MSAAEWESLPPLPEANGGFASGANRGKIVIAGGTNWREGKKHWLDAVHVYDPGRQQWSTPWTLSEPVAYGIAGIAKGTPEGPEAFVFAAGSNGSAGFNQTVWIEGTAITIKPAPGLPKPTVLAAGGVMGGKMVVVGGTEDPANLGGLRRDAFIVNLLNNQIETVASYPGKPFGTAAAAVLGNSLWIFGGANWDAVRQTVFNTDEAYAFSIAAKTWKKVKAFPYPVRGLTGIAVNDRLLYLAGGYKNDEAGFTDEAFLYDTLSGTYAPAKPLPYKAMIALVTCDGFLYCLGGEDQKQHRSDACYRIRISDLLRQ